MERVKTGIAGLDELMEGGIPKNHLVLVSGQAGAGKTIFGLQYLVKGASEFGEKGMMISFEQNREDIVLQAKDIGWDVEELEKKGLLKILTYQPSKIHFSTIIEQMDESIKSFMPSRVVLDSISTYGVYAETLARLEMLLGMGLKKEDVVSTTPESATRKAIVDVMENLKSLGITSLIISELPEKTDFLSRDTISEFLADGVIVLNYAGIAGESLNALNIRKMRRSSHSKDFIPFTVERGTGITLNKEAGSKLLLR